MAAGLAQVFTRSGPGIVITMDAVRVAWAGIDRDALISALEQHGLEPSVVDRDGEEVIEIPCGEGDAARQCDDVLSQVEALIAEHNLPLVPTQGDGQVFVHPPAA